MAILVRNTQKGKALLHGPARAHSAAAMRGVSPSASGLPSAALTCKRNTKGYSRTQLAMGFANVRAGTRNQVPFFIERGASAHHGEAAVHAHAHGLEGAS